jgi:flagellar hook-associated protein 1 FlgK
MAGGTDTDSRYSKMTAKNFAVGSEIINDYNSIAASDSPDDKGDIVNLNALLELRHSTKMFAEGAPEDFMKSLVSTLGIDSQQATRLSDNQDVIVKQLDNRRLSNSGVSIDEEMTNLVKYQQSYNACAKMINTLAGIYDTLINRLGVG